MTNAHFGRISDIEPGNPATWQGKTFLTFDIDSACDDIIDDTIELVESAGVAAIWFVTHDTPTLKRLKGQVTELHGGYIEIAAGQGKLRLQALEKNGTAVLLRELCRSLRRRLA